MGWPTPPTIMSPLQGHWGMGWSIHPGASPRSRLFSSFRAWGNDMLWLSAVSTKHQHVSDSITILCWKSSFEAILCETQWSYFPMLWSTIRVVGWHEAGCLRTLWMSECRAKLAWAMPSGSNVYALHELVFKQTALCQPKKWTKWTNTAYFPENVSSREFSGLFVFLDVFGIKFPCFLWYLCDIIII